MPSEDKVMAWETQNPDAAAKIEAHMKSLLIAKPEIEQE